MFLHHDTPTIGLNNAEQFMIDYFNITNCFMNHSDAVYITSQMGYVNAADFISDCEKYGRLLDHTKMIITNDHQSNGNVTQTEHVVDLEDLLNASESY